MKMTIVEGSFEEISQLITQFSASTNFAAAIPGVAEEQAGGADQARGRTFASLEQARIILTRRELSANIYNVLKALYEANGTRLTSEDLRKASGLNPHQFRGLMGTFHRRIEHTAGKGVSFFDDEWDAGLGQKTWSLPDTVKQALGEIL